MLYPSGKCLATVLRKRNCAEETDAPRVIDLIFTLFVWSQVLDVKARSICSLFVTAHPISWRTMDFPNRFRYNDEGEGGRIDTKVKYRVVVGNEWDRGEENGE